MNEQSIYAILSQLKDNILKAYDGDVGESPVKVTPEAWSKYESMLFDEDELRKFVVNG